ncbi:MAG TPA: SufD family Fe-S cluster assembly protein [Patescibacteria group bacterium]|nr:SufD family Fe-S cluster assembly protein [Patescibacteria group bacterium]
MTAPTETPAGSPTSAGATAPRARRAPADLPFTFAGAALAEALGAERAEPAWLRADRNAASQAFARLPVETSELYTSYVDFRAADLFAARPYVSAALAPAIPGEIPDGADGIIELREDAILRLALAPGLAERGVILETLGAALARDAAGIRAALIGTALPADEKLAWLSRGFWSQGIHFHVPAGVRLERPIVFRWAAGVPERALLTRTLIRLDEGAEAALVEELVPSVPPIACAAGEPVPQSLFGGTTEIDLGPGAVLRFASIQDLPGGTTALQQRTARIGAGATLRFAIAQLGGRVVRSRIDNRLEGDGSEVEQVEIVFGGRDQLFDLTAYTRHVGRDTTGNLLSKAVLQHGARAYIKGLISIEKSARGTDSFLGEFGMLLDRQSRSVTVPSLEIDQPDCRRAAHASSVGPIDPTQLFYLESRGITRDEARKFITLGFLEPVVARVPLEAEQERLWQLLELKWADALGAGAGVDSLVAGAATAA